MAISQSVIRQGEIFFCEPDPKDIVGSEQEGDRPWVVMSVPRCNRGNCVVGLPLSRHTEKAGAHLIKIPSNEITLDDGTKDVDRVALTDQIRALDKRRFRRKFGHISERAITSIIELGLDYLFGRDP
jgi:mRNA-degrading endonuclease toxin of MazEF toxin-antitoxin module